MFIMEWEMKIAVVGSRELKNIVLDGHIPVEATEIISGGADAFRNSIAPPSSYQGISNFDLSVESESGRSAFCEGCLLSLHANEFSFL